ncbi:uncharacterized protein TRIVIDRAFT_63814 [Trichoderma virens Gv29-8]|uniref:Uncharacterized protein n=1 Tax=Hypocrea virens (strain Gv29-8 / FGSC 10586) TaxID=413071 RepID=G9MPH2_HYPVG|nr:uncharacterized protein TRIVIDRAFT_63814 [Trichoderma virens Gv29-8]EHK23773.1 hypothetical protein TRIVIDRAFT_63814 [Trichoderma virens Gv29-8]UKZ50070.1 hypothetical protein TrVGV298_004326 [Trichoderma virens]
MPLTPQEYLDWWLTTGLDPLKELVNKEALGCGPQHVGFEQTVQRRQRGFDNDVELREALRLHVKRLSSHQSSDVSCNPRNKLRELTLNVFKKPEDGGLVPDKVLEGLADLNAVELRRRRLVAETPLIFRPGHPAFGSAAMIQELNRKATDKFGQFYMGFRASMVVEELKQAKFTRKPSVEIMAVVNALFPAHDLLKNSEDVSLVPCTDSLLGCIRFTVLYHLLGDNPLSDKQQAMIQEKLFIWCSLPRYQTAYKVFAQYIEEFKTIESLCFNVLQLAEKEPSRRRSGSHRSSFTPNSVVMVKSILKGSPRSPRELGNLAGSERSISPEFVASAPPVPNPLLKGLPGREVSPSKTDGAAFAFDDSSAPKLRYDAGDETVIKGEKVAAKTFDPGRKLKKKPLLMKQKSLPTRQKSLPTKQKLLETKQKLLPMKKKQLQTRRRRKKEDDDIPPVPPTPDIPESMKSTITRTSLKLLQRMRSHPDIQANGSSSSKLPQIASALASNKAKPSTKLAKPPTRPKVPQGQVRDSFYLRTSSFPEASIRSSQQSLYTQRAPSTQSVDRAGPVRRQDGTASHEEESLRKPEVKYSMCQPRLSNMEYTRLYLVEEANAKKEKRPCELPPPKKVWLWGPRWEEFLVLPKLPASIRRRFSLNIGDEARKPVNLEPLGQEHDSDADSVETVKGKTSVAAKPPRLSLNLEGIASSLMHLVSIDSEKASQSLAKAKPHEVVQETGEESPVLGHFAAEHVKQSCISTDDKAPDLPPVQTVSTVSTSEADDEDLYSDDRHLWPSPMSQQGTRLTSVSPISEEATETVRDDSHSIENTTPQLSDDVSETSSIYSNDSARTAVYVGNSKEAGDAPKTPQTARRLPEQLTTPDEASPVRPGITFSYSCASFNSLSSDRSPLTHFPISAEQRSRATTEDMVQGILSQSGGRLRVEDARQVQLVERKHSAEIQASSADIWHTDDYMEPELQPAPLNLSKKSSIVRPKQGSREMPERPKMNPNPLDPVQQFKYTPRPSNLTKEAPPKFHEKIKSYESGFVPLPGSLLYEADKNADIIRMPQNLSSSSNSSSSVSTIITPSKPGPVKVPNYAAQRSERVKHEPRPSRSMNELYDAVSASNASQPQRRKPSPTLSDLDEFFGIGPYEKAFLEKHPEAAKPFVLPPKVLESPEAPVFTNPSQATLMLRRRDRDMQQQRALPQPVRGTQQHRAPPQPTVQRVMERKPNTSVNVSSFALHRAQGNKATILPVVEGRSHANTTNIRGRDIGTSQDYEYEDSISEEHMPQQTQTFLDDVHRFSLQRYDISARRPSTAHARPSTLFERAAPIPPVESVASEGKKTTNSPATTLGNLFRRRNRNRKENQQ